jgi:hypothetical protein
LLIKLLLHCFFRSDVLRLALEAQEVLGKELRRVRLAGGAHWKLFSM